MSDFRLYRRAGVAPPALTGDTDQDLAALRRFCAELAQEVRQIHNIIQSFSVTVAAGAGSKAVTLPAPQPDALYRVSVATSWITAHSISAITTTGFTDTFSIAAPGGGGTLYVLLIG